MSSIKISNPKNFPISVAILCMVLLLIATYIGLRGNLGQESVNNTGVRAWLDTAYTIALYLLITVSASGLGWVVIKWVGLAPLSDRLELSLIALVMGYGILAYGVLFLGIAGVLRPWALLIWLGLASLIGIRNWSIRVILGINFKKLGSSLKLLSFYQRALLLSGILILALTFFQALAPPWDYDSQLYHLEVSRKFLTQGGIAPQPEEWLSFFPLTVEMLFTLGLGLGSDVVAKLIHLTFGIVLVLSTYTFGKRFFGNRVAWLTLGVLGGIPIIPIWAGWAYVDMGNAAFICLSAFAVITWSENNRTPWLVVAGILMGFGLGTKYTALAAGAALGLLVLWSCRQSGWKSILTHAIIFGGISLAIGAPWYIKNLLWTGNPIYPLLVGPPGWSPIHMDIWMSFVQGFGTGKSFWDYLLLPLNLYIRHERFSTGMGSVEFPSLLFPILILFPWSQRNKPSNILMFLILAQFIFWAAGSQVNRYLLPAYPFLSLLTGKIIAGLERSLRLGSIKIGAVLSHGLVLGLVATTLMYNTLYFSQIRPLEVALGNISKAAFLRRTVENYATIEYIKDNLEAESRVLMLWDGQGYYCKERCIPDIDHSQWADIVAVAHQDILNVATALKARGATHLLINYHDADYILQHDPKGYQKAALVFFMEKFRSACTRELYRTQWVGLYEVTCHA